MILNIWDTIRELVEKLINKSTGSTLAALFVGIFLGILLSLLIYIIILVTSISKSEKNDAKIKVEFDDEKKELINKYIKAAQDEFAEASEEMNISQKVDLVKELAPTLATNVATIFYPESKHPLTEISVEEIIKLDYYIMDRIEKIFDGKVLRKFKKLKISQIMKLLDAKRRFDDNKLIKASKKMHLGGVTTILTSAWNAVNPGFWIKKSIMSIGVEVTIDRIVNLIFKIVGEESAKVYSKNAFVAETSLEEDIAYLESEDEEMGGNIDER